MSRPAPAAVAIAVVVKGWPRLSETFIAQELRALERRGLGLRIYSLRHPTDGKRHRVALDVAAPAIYLPEYLWREPLRVARAWAAARRLRGYPAARARFLADWRRDPTPNRGRRFGQAAVLAIEMPDDVAALYAHFLHTPASVARYAALMRGLPWAASAHARDIWTTPDWEKREKLAAAAWTVTCTASGATHLNALAPIDRPVELLRHGIDAARFPPASRAAQRRDGSDPADPVRLLSVGRAVEKKGFDDLLAALALLPKDRAWRLVHIGGGPLLAELKRQAESQGLSARIEWRGPRTEDEVLAAYREADLFVLCPRVARDGDRDGLPNVVVEALSQRLAVVVSALPAVCELVADGATGLVAPPGDPAAFATALGRAIADPALRDRLADAGEARVARDFRLDPGADRLAAKLRSLVATPTSLAAD